ncbi:ABC transporter substrate-binding protein [Shewanella sp. SR44-3]|uniref:substrate-binding periplasmic protein n=1 Tax=Shewanella sp. SR44-3 TaxID=2760936 RepID=UPI0015FD5F67|nr:transporter substrate-binding domain-containing protein [Shewanella sp. SR44-3]MBB1270605.1 transporter substrate-binding domain-containing protein [Shewanella sp. SR44-3]
MNKWLLIVKCIFIVTYGVSIDLSAADNHKFTITGAELAPHSGQTLAKMGWVPQVLDEALIDSGYQLEYEFLPFNRALISVKKGVIDAMSPLYISESRKVFLHYSEPLGISQTALFFAKTKPIDYHNISDLKGLSIAIMRGASVNPEFDKSQDFTRVEATSYGQLVRMLLLGRVDAVVGEEFVVREIINNDKEFNGKAKLAQANVALATQGLYVGVSKAAPDAVNKMAALNTGLAALKVSGRFSQILLQHGIIYNQGVLESQHSALAEPAAELKSKPVR